MIQLYFLQHLFETFKDQFYQTIYQKNTSNYQFKQQEKIIFALYIF
jgi:hypothetical protein